MTNQVHPNRPDPRPHSGQPVRRKRRTVAIVLSLVVAFVLAAVAVFSQVVVIGHHRPGYVWVPRAANKSPQQVMDEYGPILHQLAAVLAVDGDIEVGIDQISQGRPCLVMLEAEVKGKTRSSVDIDPPDTAFDVVLQEHGFEKAIGGTDPSGRGYTLARQKRGGSAKFEYHWQHNMRRVQMVVPVTKKSCL